MFISKLLLLSKKEKAIYFAVGIVGSIICQILFATLQNKMSVLGYTILDFTKYKWVLKSPFNPAPSTQGDYIPPGDLYEVWLPLALCASLAANDINFGVLLLIHTVLFFKRIKIHLKEIFHGLARMYAAW